MSLCVLKNKAGQSVAGDLDGLKSAIVDDLRAEGIVAAGGHYGPPFHNRLP